MLPDLENSFTAGKRMKFKFPLRCRKVKEGRSMMATAWLCKPNPTQANIEWTQSNPFKSKMRNIISSLSSVFRQTTLFGQIRIRPTNTIRQIRFLRPSIRTKLNTNRRPTSSSAPTVGSVTEHFLSLLPKPGTV